MKNLRPEDTFAGFLKQSKTVLTIFTVLFWTATGCIFHSCELTVPPPESKEAYLMQFDNFSRSIAENCNQISTAKLDNEDFTYTQLSRDYYSLFYNQLSAEDKLLIWQYRSRYVGCKLKKEGKRLYEQLENNLLSIEE